MFADQNLTILLHRETVPMMAVCNRCKLKFFVLRYLMDRPLEAQAYLWSKYSEHYCKVEEFPTSIRHKPSKSA